MVPLYLCHQRLILLARWLFHSDGTAIGLIASRDKASEEALILRDQLFTLLKMSMRPIANHAHLHVIHRLPHTLVNQMAHLTDQTNLL